MLFLTKDKKEKNIQNERNCPNIKFSSDSWSIDAQIRVNIITDAE